MTRMTRIMSGALATAAGLGLFMLNDVSPTSALFVSRAHAIIGRPATPMSYAGVARRTTRGVYAAPVVAAPAYRAPVVVAPAYRAPGACVQTVDVYGRVITQCY